MKLALNQMRFPEDGLRRNAELVADAGYDSIEPNLTADGPLWDDESVDAFADWLDELDLTVTAIATTLHWDRQLASTDEATRAAGSTSANG